MAKAVVKYRTRVVKAKHRKKAGFTLPLAVVGGFLPLVSDVVKDTRSNGLEAGAYRLVANTTGYKMDSHTWDFSHMMQGTGPILLGLVVHKLAGKLGVNRMISKAGIPWIRI